MTKRSLLVIAIMTMLACTGAYATPYMGINIGTTTYAGGQQLTFSNVADDVQYAVGSYSWTQVNGAWYGSNGPASPGLGWNDIHRQYDAMGLFFKPEIDKLTFMIVTGMPSTGVTAANLGYGYRQFGPGDLKIDVGSTNYGIGIRQGGLYWGTVDPGASQPWFRISKAEGGYDAINARDAGTIGVIEKNAQWDHVDNHVLAPGSENAYAFYRAGSGTVMDGTATVTCTNTGVMLGNYAVYAYEVSVPWEALALDPSHFAFRASWRPDCGNDLIAQNFSGKTERPPVPEASTLMLAMPSLAGLALARRRRK